MRPTVQESFDYTPLPPGLAQQAQGAAQRIRQMVKQTIETTVQVGNELRAIKDALPYGHFGPWLRAEFGWSERMARNFMAVATSFGGQSARIALDSIDPTAAYLLAAPSVPEEAREEAVRRTEDGSRVTLTVAREILERLRLPALRHREAGGKKPEDGKLLGHLLESLELLRQRWGPERVSTLARQLREFADSLEETTEERT